MKFNDKEVYKVAVVGDQHIRGATPRVRKDDYFEAILAKIESILKENDIFIGLGDLFDKPEIASRSMYQFISLLAQYQALGKRFYTIPGNHDVYRYNVAELSRTSLGLLYLSGVGRQLNEIQIHNTKFKNIPFDRQVVIPKPEDQETILLGHYFYEYNLDPMYSLTHDHIVNSKAKAVILGHDHQPYKDKKCGDTWLLRPGSLCRNTAHDYQLERVPQYVQFTISADQCIWSTEPVKGAKSPEDVFITEALENNAQVPSEIQPLGFLADIQALLTDFSNSTQKVGYKLTDALADLDCPFEVMEYIKLQYEKQELNFH
jgi:DNA repair exonuclease SbcCD nuclease subunit